MAENTKITSINNDNISIVVDDGSVRVPIRNKQDEEIGVFFFRPTDIGMIDRYNAMVNDLDNVFAPLKDVNINTDGTVDENNEAEMAAMKEAKTRLYTACDKLFGGNVSEAFFGKMHPFSPINGHFYCENVLNVVGMFISKRFARETKKINTRLERYTHGYAARTGKHKNGRK